MNSISHFLDQPFIEALKAFFRELEVPVNYISDKPASASEILESLYKPSDNSHKLIHDVYALGVVDDAVFNKTQTFNSLGQIKALKTDYDGLLLFGITLNERPGELKPSRGQLADITRALNRAFPYTPVTVIFKYGDFIALANSERIKFKQEWREGEKIGNITMLKDIDIVHPHAAHTRILFGDSTHDGLKINPDNIRSFRQLYEYWQKVLNTKELNKQFFKKVANWYFWAVANVRFPYDYLKNESKYLGKTDAELQELANQKAVIRLITRIIFVWFIKEKKLVPQNLFDEKFIDKTIKKDKQTNYFNAILQNLFFATLNRTRDNRGFALDKGYPENINSFDVNTLYRYEYMFIDDNPDNIMRIFESIPFLNGGLFDSLDKKDKKEGRVFIDGFTRIKAQRAIVPDFLFFETRNVDFNEALNKIYSTSKGKYEVKGLFEIFNEYKFTIEENTPDEQDVALDPILLGEIFENLLAYYNPETSTTARKGTGSFYTPQPIVNYMVEESIREYLKTKLEKPEIDFNTLNGWTDQEKHDLVEALSDVKILDPACGSGAFPMGVLHKIVQLLKTADQNNTIWRKVQKEKLLQELDKAYDKEQKDEREAEINRLNRVFENNLEDYGRKLYIIRNCIYGVDIQDVAIQISKLRFFLALIIDQSNEHIEPLPNLETKFVIANTLIGIDMPDESVFGGHDPTTGIREELKKLREKHFTITDRSEKLKLKDTDEKLRELLAKTIEETLIEQRKKKLDALHAQMEPLKAELEKTLKLPEEFEIIETTDLFGEKSKISIDKKQAKVKDVKDRIFRVERSIFNEENRTDTKAIINIANKLASWDIYDQNTQAGWFDMNWMFGIKAGFDIVIGNPPYVNVENIDDKVKNHLFSHFKTCVGRTDIYIAFIEAALGLLNSKGILTYIIPYAYTNQNYGSLSRKMLIDKYHIREILDTSDFYIFDNAIVKNIIISIVNSTNTLEGTKIKIAKSEDTITKKLYWENKINQDLFLKLKDYRFETKDISCSLGIKSKIWEHSIRLDKICLIAYGARLNHKSKDVGKEKYLYSNFQEGYKLFTEGKNIEQYYYSQNGWLDYKPNEHYNPMFSELFENEKIIFINVVKDKLRFAFDNKCFYNSHTVINCVKWNLLMNASHPTVKRNLSAEKIQTSLNFEYPYLLGVLNSKVINWYFVNFLSESLHFYPDDAKELPIPMIHKKNQLTLINIVDRIITEKNMNYLADTKVLENQIDIMVYKLYKLTYDEVLIIDKDFGQLMSREEYEKLDYGFENEPVKEEIVGDKAVTEKEPLKMKTEAPEPKNKKPSKQDRMAGYEF